MRICRRLHSSLPRLGRVVVVVVVVVEEEEEEGEEEGGREGMIPTWRS